MHGVSMVLRRQLYVLSSYFKPIPSYMQAKTEASLKQKRQICIEI
jgi:hypothetical protein